MTPVVSCCWDVHTIIVTNCTCMINNGQLNTICFIVLTPSLILQFVCVDERAKKLFKRTYILIKNNKEIILVCLYWENLEGAIFSHFHYEFNHSNDFSSHDVRGLS